MPGPTSIARLPRLATSLGAPLDATRSRADGTARSRADGTARTGRLRDDLARLTQDLAHAYEDLIRVDPTHWHLLQPNWPSDRVGMG